MERWLVEAGRCAGTAITAWELPPWKRGISQWSRRCRWALVSLCYCGSFALVNSPSGFLVKLYCWALQEVITDIDMTRYMGMCTFRCMYRQMNTRTLTRYNPLPLPLPRRSRSHTHTHARASLSFSVPLPPVSNSIFLGSNSLNRTLSEPILFNCTPNEIPSRLHCWAQELR